MYFGSYYNDVIEQSGMDWVRCVRGRWLHEDYAEDHRVNHSGQDRFCYSCLDLEIFVLLFPKVEYTFLLVHHVCSLLTIRATYVIIYVVLIPKEMHLLERGNLLAG